MFPPAAPRPETIIDPEALARGTLVISKPGAYGLAGDAIAGNLAAGEPLIRISADDVTLDLSRHTFEHVRGRHVHR